MFFFWEARKTAYTQCHQITSLIFAINRQLKFTFYMHSLSHFHTQQMAKIWCRASNYYKGIFFCKLPFLRSKIKSCDRSMTLIFDKYFAVSLFFTIKRKRKGERLKLTVYSARISCNGHAKHTLKKYVSVILCLLC